MRIIRADLIKKSYTLIINTTYFIRWSEVDKYNSLCKLPKTVGCWWKNQRESKKRSEENFRIASHSVLAGHIQKRPK